mgnify:CR=1 FL=1|jgi:hypothetical protein
MASDLSKVGELARRRDQSYEQRKRCEVFLVRSRREEIFPFEKRVKYS